MKKNFFIGNQHGRIKVKCRHIILLQKHSRYYELVTETKTFIVKQPFNRITKKLRWKQLVQVHKNYWVPMERIMAYNKQMGYLYVQPHLVNCNLPQPETWIPIPVSKKFHHVLKHSLLTEGHEKEPYPNLDKLLFDLILEKNNN